MKTRSALLAAVLVPAVLACTVGRSREPDNAAAGAPTPAPTPRAVYIANGYYLKVPAFSPSGTPLDGFTVPSDFDSPAGVAYNPANHTLYVSDAHRNTIRTFDATTGAETRIGFANAAGLKTPVSLALAGGNLLVANHDGKNILAFDAATGAPVTKGFTSPAGLLHPRSMAVRGTTLYVADEKVGAYDLTTGAPLPGFIPIKLDHPSGPALHGNVLYAGGYLGDTVGAYDATTGAELNAGFVTGVFSPSGLAILGDRLLVTYMGADGARVGAYGLPAVVKRGDAPTSSDPAFIDGLANPCCLVVAP